MKWMLFTGLSLFMPILIFAQDNGVIKGRVYDKINNDPLSYANVVIQSTDDGTSTDEEGQFEIKGLEPGVYNLVVQYVGYKKKVVSEISVSKAREAIVNIAMEQKSYEAEEVEITASPFEQQKESPVSKRSIGVNEIQRSPGANRDISNVMQSLPGVASTVSFRNDLIIRGGAPNENSFYIDGIEVPNINHFPTQGSTGGPVGMINVDFINSVDFYSGAFPSNRSGALSAILDFKFKEGRTDRTAMRATVGASEVGVSVEGPIGDKFSYIFSARRSYLQLLFDVLGQPFLPTYNDVNYKFNYQIDNNNQISLIGIGAIDNFQLNKDEDGDELNRYILNNLPINEQWNYTTGIKYTHFGDNSYFNVYLSRFHLHNEAYKYENNIEKPENLLLNYDSDEMENQVRFEHVIRESPYKIIYGGKYTNARFKNSTFNRIAKPGGPDTIDFTSTLDVNEVGAFGQISRDFLNDDLTLSLGVRTDFNDYNDDMGDPVDQFSPRFSASYDLTNQMALNFNTGIYYQQPPYTIMGYKEGDEFVNKNNDIDYISSKHVVAGVDYLTNTNTKIALEGFYKKYDDYPFVLDDSVSLANLGGDFGVVGNSPANSSSEGRAYGAELLVQQKLYEGFYGILAYTLVWSEFTSKEDKFIPSAWDNRHIVSLTAGKKFKKNWEVGIKWRFQSGSPYTPYDDSLSAQKRNWEVRGEGVPDYDRLNEKRLPPTHGLDVRIDKKYYFDKFNLNVYLDIQNAYNFQAEGQPYLTVERQQDGEPITNPNDRSRYKTKFLENEIGTTIPSIGVIFEL